MTSKKDDRIKRGLAQLGNDSEPRPDWQADVLRAVSETETGPTRRSSRLVAVITILIVMLVVTIAIIAAWPSRHEPAVDDLVGDFETHLLRKTDVCLDEANPHDVTEPQRGHDAQCDPPVAAACVDLIDSAKCRCAHEWHGWVACQPFRLEIQRLREQEATKPRHHRSGPPFGRDDEIDPPK